MNNLYKYSFTNKFFSSINKNFLHRERISYTRKKTILTTRTPKYTPSIKSSSETQQTLPTFMKEMQTSRAPTSLYSPARLPLSKICNSDAASINAFRDKWPEG